ncbi:MAG: helix-turn-helix transcriptional regulator [Gemmatimonas sp.]
MELRLRIPELLSAAPGGAWSAWRLHVESKGRITATKAYRLVRTSGKVERSFDRETLEALCEALHVGPEQLFTFDKAPAKRPAKKAAKRVR